MSRTRSVIVLGNECSLCFSGFDSWVKCHIYYEKLKHINLLLYDLGPVVKFTVRGPCVCAGVFIPPLWVVWELFSSLVMPAPVSGLVIFQRAADTAVEAERLRVFVWKAHLAEKETSNLQPSTDRPQNPHIPPAPHNSSLPTFPSHLLPFPPGPRGKRCICVWAWWCHSWQLEV